MSIDLDWAQLDADLSHKAQQAINAALQSAPKPAFLGDITCTSFSFGRIGPQLEIVEIGEVWDEFLNVEDEEEDDYGDDEDYEGEAYDTNSHDAPWTGPPSRRPEIRRASTVSGTSSTAAAAPYARAQATSPTLSLGGWSGTGSLGMSATRPLHTPSLFTSNAGLWLHQQQQHRQSVASVGGGSSANTNLGYPFPRLNYGNNHLFNNNNTGKHDHGQAYGLPRQQREDSPFTRDSGLAPSAAAAAADAAGAGGAAPHDPLSSLSVQLHLRVQYRGTMHVHLSTSLRVNYPSLGFMALPLSLQITSLAFEGILVVAYEGGHGTGSGHRQRIHVSLLDEQLDDDDANTNGHLEKTGGKTASAPLDRGRTVRGAQLLKDARVESEVGQREKLVLKDVESVENFVLEMARKALEDEIAWPNFQSFAWT